MAIYYRKSVNLGPFRVNLLKAGAGLFSRLRISHYHIPRIGVKK